jgi:squalene-hopene/tetraprenyl-beta-curcumene cyclase
VPRPEGRPKALNVKAVLFALALESDPAPDDVTRTGLNLMLQTVREDQTENGSWVAWPETRPPIFGGSDDSMTALATLALVPAAASGGETMKQALDKAVKWLVETSTDDDPQSVAMRLVVWTRLNRPADEREVLVRRIRERQNDDGGWNQAADTASDAWATGQALYALAHAGIKSDDEVVKRAQSFLVSTQRDDGSWPMTSRPMKPGGEGASSLIPITGGGSAWAVLGLVRSR